MSKENIQTFGGRKLWCIAGSDVDAAAEAISTGSVEGILVSQHQGFTGRGLSCLANLKDLRILVIVDAVGVDISYVQKIRSLEYLSIGHTDGVVSLDGLSGLKHLRLQIIKDRFLPKSGLSKLCELALWNYMDSDLSILSGYPELQSLEITQAKKLNSLSGIEYCKKLINVAIAYCPKLLNIDALGKLTDVKKLDFSNTKRIQEYRAIGSLVDLRNLIIYRSSPMRDLGVIGGLAYLESLVIKDTNILNADLSPLKSMNHLSHVYLDNKKQYEPVLSEVKKMVRGRKVITE